MFVWGGVVVGGGGGGGGVDIGVDGAIGSAAGFFTARLRRGAPFLATFFFGATFFLAVFFLGAARSSGVARPNNVSINSLIRSSFCEKSGITQQAVLGANLLMAQTCRSINRANEGLGLSKNAPPLKLSLTTWVCRHCARV